MGRDAAPMAEIYGDNGVSQAVFEFPERVSPRAVIAKIHDYFSGKADLQKKADVKLAGAADDVRAMGQEYVRYSIANINGERVVLLDRNTDINWNDKNSVEEYIASLVGTGEVSLSDGERITIGKEMPKEYTRSNYAEKIFRNKLLRKVRGKKKILRLPPNLIGTGRGRLSPFPESRRCFKYIIFK